MACQSIKTYTDEKVYHSAGYRYFVEKWKVECSLSKGGRYEVKFESSDFAAGSAFIDNWETMKIKGGLAKEATWILCGKTKECMDAWLDWDYENVDLEKHIEATGRACKLVLDVPPGVGARQIKLSQEMCRLLLVQLFILLEKKHVEESTPPGPKIESEPPRMKKQKQ